MGSALATGGSILGPAGTGSVQHRGSFWCLLTEATPAVSPLPNRCHINPVHDLRETLHRRTQHHTTFFLKGRCLEEAARPWDRAAAGTQGKRLSQFVSAPAPWPWQ